MVELSGNGTFDSRTPTDELVWTGRPWVSWGSDLRPVLRKIFQHVEDHDEAFGFETLDLLERLISSFAEPDELLHAAGMVGNDPPDGGTAPHGTLLEDLMPA